jgi:hypothetical protein
VKDEGTRAPWDGPHCVRSFNVRGDQSPGEQISRHLQQAIENLQREALKVEIWAAALSGFARPIPSYEPTNDNLLPSVDDGFDDDLPPPDRDVQRHQG